MACQKVYALDVTLHSKLSIRARGFRSISRDRSFPRARVKHVLVRYMNIQTVTCATIHNGNMDPFAPIPHRSEDPYQTEFASPDGKFDVRLLDGAAVPAAARILQQSGLLRGAYSTCEELEDYLSGTMGAYPNGGFLVGRSWAPSDSCNGVLDVPVVATIGVSLTPDTRKKDKLAAPANAAYVSELAVEAASRGRGYGKLMLRAAEDMSMQMGISGVSLHVRMDKPHLVDLYSSQGYRTLKKEGFALRRRDYRRALMYKALDPA